MLEISTTHPKETEQLSLGGGAKLMLRRATSFDVIAAESEAVRVVAGIENGLAALADYLLGESDAGAIEHGALLAVLTDVELAMRVVVAVENVVLDGETQTVGSRRLFAALFREEWALNAFRARARGVIHLRTLVGNASAPSPNGAPKEEPPSAAIAPTTEPPAPAASAETMASAAPSMSTEN
jgi:hypothetical protein